MYILVILSQLLLFQQKSCFSASVEAESRRGGVERAAAESGVMKTQKFTWSKDGAKSFEWRKIYHALVGTVGPGEGGLLAEALITPTSMRTGQSHTRTS